MKLINWSDGVVERWSGGLSTNTLAVPFRERCLTARNIRQRGDCDRSADMFRPGSRSLPLPGGERRGEGERKCRAAQGRHSRPLLEVKAPHESPIENPPLPGPLLPPREEREKIICGVASQGGARRARLPWAIIILPLRGVEAHGFNARGLNLGKSQSSRAWLSWMLAIWCGLFAATRVEAQNPAPANDANRFLVIIETSRAMQRQREAVGKALEQVLASRANGQLRRGDTLGVWTFNEDVYTGRFPLQVWSLEAERAITNGILEFVKGQPYEKNGRFDNALAGMHEVMKISDLITILIFSSGAEPMRGTPFDKEINAAFQQHLAEAQKDRTPMATVLQAQRGKIINYTVNALPWPVVVPELPVRPETAAIAKATNPPPVVMKTNGPALLPPLILSGPKPAPVVTNAIAATQPPATGAPVKATETASVPVTAGNPTAAIAASNASATATENAIRPDVQIAGAPPVKSTEVVSAQARETAGSSNSQAGQAPPGNSDRQLTNASVVQAVAVSPDAKGNSKMFLAAGLGLLAVAGSLVWLMARRARGAAGSSAITRAMNSRKK
jgi:hypothetical protein